MKFAKNLIHFSLTSLNVTLLYKGRERGYKNIINLALVIEIQQ